MMRDTSTTRKMKQEKNSIAANTPALWYATFPWPRADGHKYDRGATLVYGGPPDTAGAAKLAALAALRTGSGTVTIACEEHAVMAYAATATSLMTLPMHRWQERMLDTRVNTVIAGPGAGVSEHTRAAVLSALAHGKQLVLDADGITAFEAMPGELFRALGNPAILTPHAGEFRRLFPFLAPLAREEAAARAAERAQAVVIYKGQYTVIAAPDGRIAVNRNAPPDLATAGSGDVLAGICGGLLAQGMEPFSAACAAVWMHGEAASLHGPGLIADDIIARLPAVLRHLQEMKLAP